MRQIRILLLNLLAGALLVSGAALAANASNDTPASNATNTKGAKQLTAQSDPVAFVKKECGGCHGENGNGLKPAVPRLAGQHADYLYKQLRNFKAADGKPAGPDNPMYPTPADLVYVAAPEGKLPERRNPVYFLAMNGMVMKLSDADMKVVAKYFSEQKVTPPTAPAKTGAAMEAAKRLYRVGDPARGLASCAGCHGPKGAGLPAQFPRLAGQFASYTLTQLKSFRTGERFNDPNSMMRDVAYKLTDDEIAQLAEFIEGLR